MRNPACTTGVNLPNAPLYSTVAPGAGTEGVDLEGNANFLVPLFAKPVLVAPKVLLITLASGIANQGASSIAPLQCLGNGYSFCSINSISLAESLRGSACTKLPGILCAPCSAISLASSTLALFTVPGAAPDANSQYASRSLGSPDLLYLSLALTPSIGPASGPNVGNTPRLLSSDTKGSNGDGTNGFANVDPDLSKPCGDTPPSFFRNWSKFNS